MKLIKKVRLKLHNGKKKVARISGNVAVKVKFWANVHYLLIDLSLYREMHGINSGIIAHRKRTIDGNTSFLRRCIHRIEKGLSSKNRRKKFAEQYILDAVIAFKKEFESKGFSETINWAYNTFTTYFEEVEHTPQIDKAHKLFDEQIVKLDTRLIDKREMIRAGMRNDITVTYEDYQSLNLRRRSVRSYKNQPVERDKIEKALSIALQAPSACNRQPFSFKIVENKEKLLEVGSLPLGAATFYEDIPLMVFAIGDLSAYEYIKDRHIIYVDTGLVVMNFILALETLGLSSCVINWPDVKEAEMKLARSFDLEPHEKCVTCIAVGYADDECYIPLSEKKKVNNVIEYY
ncbi:nitroreductase family protein [Maribellus sediminis]|uniref:nitroreductase family protein n=1 Tax=Maribellus sediminis TaxID=2696285 RepID=UPI00143011A4|nr:nitroreductase family protein [Maribellus sediminis]